ncbi:MAG: PilZ domain-containing protein [Fibrobacterota bacterium]
MKILIYEPNIKLRTYLRDFSITKGLIPQFADTPAQVENLVSTGLYDFLLTDYSEDIPIINEIFFNIKLNKKLAPLRIFVSTPRPERETLQRLIRIGINGFIKKPFQQRDFEALFEKWLQKNSFRKNKRVHQRIAPSPSDNAFVKISPETRNRDMKMPIIDISAGGISIHPPPVLTLNLENNFPKGKVFKNIKLRIRHFGVFVSLQVVFASKEKIGMKFVHTPTESLRYIYRYIADNING